MSQEVNKNAKLSQMEQIDKWFQYCCTIYITKDAEDADGGGCGYLGGQGRVLHDVSDVGLPGWASPHHMEKEERAHLGGNDAK